MSNIFNDISTGNLNLAEEEVFTEATYPSSVGYMKTMTRQISLPLGEPIGKGNICFLYSHNLNESIALMQNKTNFLNQNRYKFYYYNMLYSGKLYNKRYRFYDLEERKEYYKEIKDTTDITPRLKIANNQDNRNLFYDLFRYLEIFQSICSKLHPVKYIETYWAFMSIIYNQNFRGYTNKFVLVDLSKYSLTKVLKENLTNPLFIIYYTLLRKPELITSLDLDFYFFNKKQVLKVNPSNCDKKSYVHLRAEMKKIMNGTNVDVNKVTDDQELQKEEIEAKAISAATAIVQDEDETPITTTQQLVDFRAKASPVEKEIENKVKDKADKIAPIVADTKVNTDQISKSVVNSVQKEIDSDREMIKKIYYQTTKTSPQKKSQASTARDELLRKEQENIKVGDMTIADIKKIKANEIKVPVTDVSDVVTTTNDNMKHMQFVNLDKTYNQTLMKRDITNAILSLNNKSIPMFVRDIKIEDTSDELNYKDTYTIYLEDGNRKRHTIKVDIPKFIEGQFLYLGGNKKIIKHQNFFYPVTKIAPDMVQIVTNYSKMSIQRVENKSISSVERLKKLISKSEEMANYFQVGNVYSNNQPYVTTLEYDDLSKNFSSFKNGKTFLMFDQSDVEAYMNENGIPQRDHMLYIGKNNGVDTYIDIDTQVDDRGKTIIDIILDNISEDLASQYGLTKAPKRLMYTKVRIMKQFVTVGMLLGLWEGFSSLLKKLKVEYRVEDKVPGQMKTNEEFLKFSDCVIVYKQDIPISLILNGFKLFDTSKYRLTDFDEKIPYIDYIRKVYGNAIIENALMNFYEFAIDNITLEILQDQNLPTDIVNLFIYAVNLLSDSHYINDISQNLSRVRRDEIIPAILYERLAKNYVTYRNFNGRKKFSIPQDCVIKEILALKTVEDYSTLNPTLELQALHGISSKGFRGVNLEETYTMAKRAYDPSMTGIIAPSSSPDGQVGVNKTLTMEPKIMNLRGYTEDNSKSLDKLKDVNLFSPSELSIPLGSTIDDPTRLGFE